MSAKPVYPREPAGRPRVPRTIGGISDALRGASRAQFFAELLQAEQGTELDALLTAWWDRATLDSDPYPDRVRTTARQPRQLDFTITNRMMGSVATRHTAAAQGDGTRTVSWLPGRTLSRRQATFAMMIAQTVGDGIEPDDRRWPADIGEWAAELGMTGPCAVERVCQPDQG
jgi:hypothetical protein